MSAKEPGMQPCLKYLLYYLRFVGLDPRWQNAFSRFQNIMFMIGLGTLSVPMATDLIFNWQGVNTLTQIDALPVFTVNMMRFLCFVIKNDDLLDIIETTKRLWPHDKFGPEAEQRQKKIYKNTNVFLTVSVIIMIFTFIGYMFNPIFQGIRELPILAYDICDLSKPPCFELLWTAQTITTACTSTFVLLGFDLLFLVLGTYTYAAFEMVIVGFRSLDLTSPKVNQQLGEVVEQHDLVLKFLMKVDKFYNVVLSLQFLGGAGQLILNLYMMMREGIPPKLHLVGKYGVFYYVLNTQMLLYCIIGTVLSDKTQQVAEEVFGIEWWETGNVSLGRSLRFVIEVAQRGRQLSLGKVVNLDLMLYVEVVKTTTQIYILINAME